MAEPFVPGFVKICGVTNVDDALFAAEVGASAVGVIFAPSSRQVTADRARPLLEALRGRLLRVGVIRELSDEEIVEIALTSDLDAVQLHDAVSEELLASLRARRLLVIKALNIEESDFSSFDEYRVDAVLIDGPQPGSGVAHSWEPLRDRHFGVPVIAAGGLNPSNVRDVILSTGAIGVDSSSGVESSPGQKDHALVSSFVERARAAFASLEHS